MAIRETSLYIFFIAVDIEEKLVIKETILGPRNAATDCYIWKEY